ncbi:MAG TPA: hypothetical protein VFO72_05080 [Pyrinomonadaceae bacterium]|nr:hypothetical protein [Pyrinomonadaceae bacterium]
MTPIVKVENLGKVYQIGTKPRPERRELEKFLDTPVKGYSSGMYMA